MRRWLAAACLLVAGAAAAQTVSMSGRLGDRAALLMIDGSPRTVAVGSTVQGVKLVSLNADGSVVETGGKRFSVPLGGTQVNLAGAGGDAGGSRIVLNAGPGGHFVTGGAINGRAVQFVVDTGATSVSMSESEADRIGLRYREAQRGMANTANGTVPVYRLNLTSVRVGEVTVYGVEALVVPAQMPYVLLGNSFLTRFQMSRVNDVMTLERR
jgi:aspartyl protease family protein